MNLADNNKYSVLPLFQILNILLFCFLYLQPVSAEFLLFGDIMAFVRSDPKSDKELDNNDVLPNATLFYSGEIGKTRLLAEYTVDDQKTHLGRAKLGWDLADTHTVWLGRLHNPGSYWRSQNHHGAYLQATISRPALSEFEASGGILPAHMSGVLFDGTYTQGEGSWRYLLGAGFGPRLSSSGLVAPKIIAGSRGEHDSSLAFRTGWSPDSIFTNELGFFISRNHLASDFGGVKEVEQFYGGFYINWEIDRLSIISETYYISNEIHQRSSTVRDSFSNAYFQMGYQFSERWRINGRIEQSWGSEGDAYLSLFSNFAYQRRILALRYDFTHQQALKFELERAHQQSNHSYNQGSIQWSIVFP